MSDPSPSPVMKERIPVIPGMAIGDGRINNASYFPGFDEVSEIMRMARDSVAGVDAARRILTQLAHKALKEPKAALHCRLYQVALEDIGEKFDHPHESRPFLKRISEPP